MFTLSKLVLYESCEDVLQFKTKVIWNLYNLHQFEFCKSLPNEFISFSPTRVRNYSFDMHENILYFFQFLASKILDSSSISIQIFHFLKRKETLILSFSDCQKLKNELLVYESFLMETKTDHYQFPSIFVERFEGLTRLLSAVQKEKMYLVLE